MKKPGLRIVLPVLLLLAAVLAGFLWYRHESSPVRVAGRALRAIPGLEADWVREASPGRLLAGHLRFHRNGQELARCEGAEILYGESGVLAVKTESLEISGLPELLPLLAEAVPSETSLPELELAGVVRRRIRGKSAGCNFRLELKKKEDGYRIALTFPQYRLSATGNYDARSRKADLKLQGQVAPDLLELLEIFIPAELELSGPFSVEARLALVFAPGQEPQAAFSGELTFPEETEISGGAWAFSPGARAVFHWNGAKRPWEMVLPKTMLRRPLELPLGALTVSGGTDSTIRFSVVNAPLPGELTGVMRIDGHYDRSNGNWQFRQSESTDRTARWNGELPFGDFDCIWRDSRVSGGGTRSRGSVEFSFGVESLQWRAPGNPRGLAVHPGTISGSWSFDGSAPESSGFELSGLVRSGKVDWPDPESAWSATGALISFRYSRQSGEKEARLVLEPEFGGINLYGGGVPKLKLEGVSGKFSTGFDPAGENVFPLRVEGEVAVRRMNPVRSMFGAGEFRELRVSGFAGLASSGMVQELRATGGGEEALFRYPECEISAAQPELDIRFERNAVTPGDNFFGRMTMRNLVLSAFGGRFSVPRGEAAWSGELRDSGLLPELWRVGIKFPAGTVAGNGFNGSFRALAGKMEFDHARLLRLETEMTGFDARFGAVAGRSVSAEKQVLTYARGKESGSGEFRAENGGFRENGSGADRISVVLPLEWKNDNVSGEGTIRVGDLTLPGGIVRSAAGRLRLENGVFSASGTASSPALPDGSLLWNGELSRGARWRLSGGFNLRPVELSKPLTADGLLPVFSNLSFTGGLSGNGLFELLPEKTAWSCELHPSKAALSGNGIAFSGLSGALRLAENSVAHGNPGGEFRFESVSSGPVEVRNGALAFRLPRPGECDVLNGSGTIWGGRARLAAPFTLRVGSGPVEAGVVVRGLEWAGLLKTFGLAPDLIGGRADGTLLWHLDSDGKTPTLASAELTADGPRRLKLESLEPYIAPRSGQDRKILFELLRDFDCRTLRLRAEGEPDGGILAELAGAGRPAGPGYRKLLRSVDPAVFGLDDEIDFTVNYRIPGRKEPGRAK